MKNLNTFLLTAAFVFASFGAFAQFNWELSAANDTLYITGSGEIPDGKGQWYDFRASIKHLEISDNITKIGDSVFYEHSELTSVILPESLQFLGNFAFQACSKLESIVLPQSLNTLSDGAFLECFALKSATNMNLVPQEININVFTDSATVSKCTLKVPAAALNAYRNSEKWKNFDPIAGICHIAVKANNDAYGTVSGGGTALTIEQTTVQATPNPGYAFKNWTNESDGVLSTANPYKFLPMFDIMLIGNFVGIEATLKNLSVSSGTLTPTFSSEITDYTVNVENAVNVITLFAEATDSNAVIKGDTGTKALELGDNDFVITVTAEDETTEETYNIKVVRKPVSIGEAEDNKEVIVYPNPVKNTLIVTGYSEDAVEMKLYNMEGKLLLTHSIKDATTIIDLQEQSAGIYFLHLYNKDGKSSVKEIVKL